MAIKSFPYTSVDGDRKITASSEAERLDQIVGSGIIFDVPTSFECSKVDGSMNISVASGSAIVAGHTIISDSAETVSISASDSANPRIDIVVLESNINTDVRTGRIVVIKGTAAATPIEPALSTDIGISQIKLAKVLVPPSVASLSTATLTDLRTVCVGKHAHTLEQLPSSYTIAFNYTNGILISTNILASSNTMFKLDIKGNGFGSGKVLDIVMEGYLSNTDNVIVNLHAIALDYWSTIDAFNYNGYLYFWMANPDTYASINAKVTCTNSTDHSNRITSITNAAKPTTGVTHAVTVNPAKINDPLAPYSVGSIYMSVVSTSPATLFGGTWAAWGTGRVPVGIDTGQTEFNTVEKTGGHKLLQAHTHSLGVGTSGTTGTNSAQGDSWGPNNATVTGINSSGGGDSQNLQPYITCYMWKRTA